MSAIFARQTAHPHIHMLWNTVHVKNVTIAVDEEILARSRTYARQHGMTLNCLIRTLLERTVTPERNAPLDRLFDAMDAAHAQPAKPWTRDELCQR